MELNDYRKTNIELCNKIVEIRSLIDRTAKENELTELEKELASPDLWNDQNQAKKTTKRISQLREEIDHIDKLDSIKDDMETFLHLLDEDYSEDFFADACKDLPEHQSFIDKTEIECLLNENYDHNDALFIIHAGAGGTEAMDWTQMLLRMYARWAEKNKFGITQVDVVYGEEAGIKSVSVEITGNYAYGLLKAEIGIHRLVRISPFNSQGKRQTSFASVFVYPEIDDDIEVGLESKDLKIDTYRASGAGGQHVNTTDSAVRITHLPTGIIVSCQNERSQNQNKDKALSLLKSRLFQYYEEQREKEKKSIESTKTDIGWGNQIRSYVFQPYQMVKDHRTNFESGNMEKVMDGDLDGFIYAWLRARALAKTETNG